jgi:hypothetical protein
MRPLPMVQPTNCFMQEEGTAIISEDAREDRAEPRLFRASAEAIKSKRFHKPAKYARENWLLIVLFALCVTRLWLMPLPSSLWTDETATVYVVHHGADDPYLKVAPQIPASLYYWLPRVADRLFGFSEIGYRIPSVLAMGIALWLIGRLAARLIHPDASWFVIMACLCLPHFNYFAVDARPYALGICMAAAAILFIVRWLDDPNWQNSLLFAVFAALVWWIHLINWPFYLPLFFYALARLLWKKTQVGWGKAAAVFGLLGLMLLPVLFQAIRLYGKAQEHVIAELPTIKGDLIPSFHLRIVLQCGIAAVIVFLVLRRREKRSIPGATILLIAGWWLCQPVSLFSISHITGNSIFVLRYLSLSLPATALVVAALMSYFIPKSYWKPAALVLAIVALGMRGDWRHTWPIHDSNWKDAACTVNRVNAISETPVICPSPFIEAQWPNWQPDYRVPGFLYCQLESYPVHGRIIPFPFKRTPMVMQYAKNLLRTTLPSTGQFIIYGGKRDAKRWISWFENQPELANWSIQRLGEFEDIEAALFLRGPAQNLKMKISQRE